MDFEQWWKESGTNMAMQRIEVVKSLTRAAWQASRDNQQEYQKYGFCRAVDCENIYNQTACVVPHDVHCSFTAKELLSWLKDNGYRIVRD